MAFSHLPFSFQCQELLQRYSMDQQLVDIYEKKLNKTGVAYTGQQLLQIAKEKKIRPLPSSQSIYTFLREQQSPSLAAFSKHVKKPSHYQTVGLTKPGVYFIDYGEFHKSWSTFNDRCTGFLVAVENLTNRLFAYPTQGKDTNQWLDSIARFIEINRDVSVIFSDRDSVATSPKFRTEVQEKYGLNWYFLKKGNKSFLAERYIGYLKTQLSKALASQSATKTTLAEQQRWVEYLPRICETYNSQTIPGTRYKRSRIDAANFDLFAEQLFKVKDIAGERYNSFVKGAFEHHDRWTKIIFKFAVGDKVLLAKAANWKVKSSIFAKASIEGNFGTTLFTISGRQLRATKKFDRLVPVYSLAEFDDKSFHFYENELVRSTATNDVTQEAASQ